MSTQLARFGDTDAQPLADAILKNGDLFLQNIEISPDPVQAGSVLSVAVTASNRKLSVQGSGNPDCCGPACGLPGSWASNGFTYEIIAQVGDSQQSTGEHCLGTTEIGTFDRRHLIELLAPSTGGQHTVTLTFRLTGSGESAQATRTVDVATTGGGGDGGCSSDADCPEGQVCQNGVCVFPDGGDGGDGEQDTIFGIPQNQALLGAGLLTAGAGALVFSMGDGGGPRQRRSRQRR